MSQGTELIWVEKEFAEKYSKMANDESLNEQRLKALDEYIQTIKKASKDEYRANLDSLEEDLAIYNGLMLKTKQSFEKAKNAAIGAAYELWEQYDKEKPNIEKKIDVVVSSLDPLVTKLEHANDLLNKIRTYDIERLIEILEKLTGLYGEQRDMIEFLMTHFNNSEKQK